MTDFAKSAPSGAKEPANAVENADIVDLPFEKALSELETIVGRLERGDVPLEESIAIYERGEALKLRCEALLQLAEARIERITLSAQGKPTGTMP
ncbi:MAG: exodeoxyribonuclease VII small subunit, partial [Hyphomicrobiales bacterium]|nr:exodeoxyribonuclease VII small subunit [Hyphomicrobiales bacterium]MBV9755396.1 exodeoxyribonuclease VII small subunit [Hyphomicrobiales bacterium]